MSIKRYIPKRIKPHLINFFESILEKSLKSALKEQRLQDLAGRLKTIVPDITNQYSKFKVKSSYYQTKVRNMHAFQISLVQKIINEFVQPLIVDIGDSAGTHLQYIIGLFFKDKPLRSLSVNIDAECIEKIRKKGMEAICARAENLSDYNINPDIFLCFQTLEHLMDPCNFLHQLAIKTTAKYMVVTVPYLKNSRVGLEHIRNNRQDNLYPQALHVFELDPEDWKLIIRHSGWNIVDEKIYLQYPKRGFFSITKPLWMMYDFEGFYGLILKRDDFWSSKYIGWEEADK